MDELLLILCGVGLAAACGLRVFLPLFLASLAVNLGYDGIGGFELRDFFDEEFAWLGSTPMTVMLGAATVVEIGSYYIPWLDNALDTIATPAAVLAGWFLSGVMMPDVMGDGPLRWGAAAIVGGGTAGLVQSGTVALRGASSASTGGLGNPLVATLELVGSVIASVLAFFAPLVAGVLAILLVVFIVRRLARFRRGVRSDPEAAVE